MAGALRKTMVYLGLSDDDRRDENYDDRYEGEREEFEDGYVEDEPEQEPAPVTPLRSAPSRPVSQPTGDLRRINTIQARSYNDAKSIGAAFREGTPVIMNLTDMDESDAKRLVDFSAGLIFGLRGSIERVTAKVFLLTPETVEISGATSTDTQASFFNQS